MTTNELLARGIGHNCLSDAYDLGKTAGKAEGYYKAENDYFAKTQKDIENAYNRGYEVGYEVGKTYEREEWEAAAGELIMQVIYMRLCLVQSKKYKQRLIGKVEKMLLMSWFLG